MEHAADRLTQPILWTAAVLPSVVALSATPTELARSDTNSATLKHTTTAAQDGPERLIICGGAAFRVHLLGDTAANGLCVALPLDSLFAVRVSAAQALWNGLNERAAVPNSAMLPSPQRARLVLALRALDARLDKATYREIAAALFGAKNLPERGWKSHDLRDRTIRLARLGTDLMQDGYRQLLLYPFRQRL